MNILFINLPYFGHVIPTIGLVQELIKKNCDVTYMLPFDWEDKISDSGAKFYGYQNHRQLSEQIKNAYAAAETIIEQFDLIIYEQFFFLGKHLAEKYDKPVVRIFTAPVTNKALMDEYIHADGPLSIFRYKWITKAFTKDIAKNIPLKTDHWLDEIVYNPPELNLVYTLRDYQPYESEFDDSKYKFIGPSVYNRKENSFDFTKTNRPVIYISLGTILKGKTSFFQKCVEAFGQEEMDVIISAGKSVKLKKVPANIHIYPSVPQLAVLKMADVFITHGGMNSVSEALTFGTPMILLPFVSDQPVNARSMAKIGVGKVLDPSHIQAETLKSAVLSVLTDEKIHNNMKQIQQSIQNAPGNQGGAEMIIKYYGESK